MNCCCFLLLKTAQANYDKKFFFATFGGLTMMSDLQLIKVYHSVSSSAEQPTALKKTDRYKMSTKPDGNWGIKRGETCCSGKTGTWLRIWNVHPLPKPRGRENMRRHWRLFGELDSKGQDEFFAISNSTTCMKAEEAERLKKVGQKAVRRCCYEW